MLNNKIKKKLKGDKKNWFESTQVRISNLWLRSWDQNNPI